MYSPPSQEEIDEAFQKGQNLIKDDPFAPQVQEFAKILKDQISCRIGVTSFCIDLEETIPEEVFSNLTKISGINFDDSGRQLRCFMIPRYLNLNDNKDTQYPNSIIKAWELLEPIVNEWENELCIFWINRIVENFSRGVFTFNATREIPSWLLRAYPTYKILCEWDAVNKFNKITFIKP